VLKNETFDMRLLLDLITHDFIPIIVICSKCISIIGFRTFLFKFVSSVRSNILE
jgi:hypothetical protein